jgi:hypothetical protein
MEFRKRGYGLIEYRAVLALKREVKVFEWFGSERRVLFQQ